MPVQVRAEVLAREPVGAYHHIVLRAPGIPAEVRPGHFVAIAVGGEESGLLLRRAFSIHRADPREHTVEIVLAEHGPGTRWLAARRPGDVLDVVGPLGQPFRLPDQPAACALVAGGYGSAPMFALAEALRAAGSQVHMVLGAATADRLFGVEIARECTDSVIVTTDDGSMGQRGLVTDGLHRIMTAEAVSIVYACGPMPMLAAVAGVAGAAGAQSQCAVEEEMACGIGVCMTCVLPVRGADGMTRMLRSCTEGPVFAGDSVRWAEVGTVPGDTVGAIRMGSH